MKNTLVVMGSHPGTRKDFDWKRTDCDIVVFNEAMKQTWVERADYVMQMHLPVIWRNPGNRNDTNHYKWLQSGETPTIIMQDKFEDVPNSVRYPIEDVLKLGHSYLTSSAAYAIAWGIVTGYERIEIYGVEMETNTEFQHQRPGVAYWIGLAKGSGVDVDFHGKLLTSPLYGYEGDIRFPYEYFNTRKEELTATTKVALDTYNKSGKEAEVIVQNYLITGVEPDRVKRILQQHAELAAQFGLQDGARQEVCRYQAKADKQIAATGDYLFSRQEFEHASTSLIKERDNAIINAKIYAGNCEKDFEHVKETPNKMKRRYRMEKFSKTVLTYIKESVKVGMFDGARKENQLFMAKLDELGLMAGGEKSVEVMQAEYREKEAV
jgi:hypothetical protein